MSHEWGNYPENFTPKMYWGARAIIERAGSKHNIVLLPDRQSFERLNGSRMDEDDFVEWINSKVLPAIREKAESGYFCKWEDMFTLDSDSGAFRCEASPKNSGGGYLYIGCWEAPQDGENESSCNRPNV